MPDLDPADIEALLAMASAFDAQRAALPALNVPLHTLDPSSGGRQVAELGGLITDLGNEIHFRALDPDRATPDRASLAFANAVRPAGEAAAAVGELTRRSAYLTRAANGTTIAYAYAAFEDAAAALEETAAGLHAAATFVSPNAERANAARSRSTVARSAPEHPPIPTPLPAPPARPVGRSR